MPQVAPDCKERISNHELTGVEKMAQKVANRQEKHALRSQSFGLWGGSSILHANIA
jgi:hypothetical protein